MSIATRVLDLLTGDEPNQPAGNAGTGEVLLSEVIRCGERPRAGVSKVGDDLPCLRRRQLKELRTLRQHGPKPQRVGVAPEVGEDFGFEAGNTILRRAHRALRVAVSIVGACACDTRSRGRSWRFRGCELSAWLAIRGVADARAERALVRKLKSLFPVGEPNHVQVLGDSPNGALVAAVMGRRKVAKGEAVPTGTAHAVGGLALINVALAVFW